MTSWAARQRSSEVTAILESFQIANAIAAAIRSALIHPALPYVLAFGSVLLILPALWVGFQLDDAHAAPTAYLANRNAVIATCLGVLCLACFVSWRRHGSRRGAVWSPVFLALALSAGEMAVSTCAYLASYALFVDRDRWSRRLFALAPHGAVVLGWGMVYAAFGFGSSGSGFCNHPLSDSLGFVGILWERGPLLLLGQWMPVPADLALASDPTQNYAAGLQGAGLAVAVVLAILMARLLRRNRIARFWCVGALLSLVPISAVGP